MVPPRPLKRSANEARAQELLDCAEKLHECLQKRDAVPPALEAAVDAHVQRSFPLPHAPALADRAQAFDVIGVKLFNTVASVQMEETTIEPSLRRACLVRLLALMLLETSFRLGNLRQLKHHARIIRSAIRVVQACVSNSCLDLALKGLEICSEHIDIITSKEFQPQLSGNGHEQATDGWLVSEAIDRYHLLRVLHACKTGRPDLAELFLSKIDLTEAVLSVEKAENTADVFYEVGKSLVETGQHETALVWFDRALGAIQRSDAADMTQELSELHVCIGLHFVEALFLCGTAETRQRSWDIINQLDNAYGLSGRVAIELMRLRLLLTDQVPNESAIREVLVRICKMVVLTENNFKMIMHQMRRVNLISPSAALAALRTFIISRLLGDPRTPEIITDNHKVWIEKASVAFILFSSHAKSNAPSILKTAVQELLDVVHQKQPAPFSPQATHAAQAIIWKVTDSAEAEAAASLSDVLQHPLFDNASQTNKGRIVRRIMSYALRSDDVPTARQAYLRLAPAARNDCATRYWTFKLALHCEDLDLAQESLILIAQTASKDSTYLFACALDASRSKMRSIAVAALQYILDKKPAGVHLPSLLRCAARLIMDEPSLRHAESRELVQRLVDVFEAAAMNLHHLRSEAQSQWQSEVQWWSKNAYNLVMQLCGTAHPTQVVKLAKVCNKFLECCTKLSDNMQADEVQCRKLMCSSLSATAFVTLARAGSPGDSETQQNYNQALECIGSFDQGFQAIRSSVRRDIDATLPRHALQMMNFRLECVLRLGLWDQISKALQTCLEFSGADRWDTLVNLLLFGHELITRSAPESARLLMEVLQKGINETWRGDRNTTKVARWIRVTVVICLRDEGSDLSLKLAQQAASIAEGGQKGRHDPYPQEELHWLSSTSFNRAVDFLALGLHDAAMEWMAVALEMARWADDNGSLHALLTSRREAALQRIRCRQEP